MSPDPEDLTGCELSRRFYDAVVAPLLLSHWPGLPHAAARIGAGSEVLGLDDEMSRDHDWGLRFQRASGAGSVPPRSSSPRRATPRDLRRTPGRVRLHRLQRGAPSRGGGHAIRLRQVPPRDRPAAGPHDVRLAQLYRAGCPRGHRRARVHRHRWGSHRDPSSARVVSGRPVALHRCVRLDAARPKDAADEPGGRSRRRPGIASDRCPAGRRGHASRASCSSASGRRTPSGGARRSCGYLVLPLRTANWRRCSGPRPGSSDKSNLARALDVLASVQGAAGLPSPEPATIGFWEAPPTYTRIRNSSTTCSMGSPMSRCERSRSASGRSNNEQATSTCLWTPTAGGPTSTERGQPKWTPHGSPEHYGRAMLTAGVDLTADQKKTGIAFFASRHAG